MRSVSYTHLLTASRPSSIWIWSAPYSWLFCCISLLINNLHLALHDMKAVSYTHLTITTAARIHPNPSINAKRIPSKLSLASVFTIFLSISCLWSDCFSAIARILSADPGNISSYPFMILGGGIGPLNSLLITSATTCRTCSFSFSSLQHLALPKFLVSSLIDFPTLSQSLLSAL